MHVTSFYTGKVIFGELVQAMSENIFFIFCLVQTVEMSDTVPVTAFGAPVQSFQQR